MPPAKYYILLGNLLFSAWNFPTIVWGSSFLFLLLLFLLLPLLPPFFILLQAVNKNLRRFSENVHRFLEKVRRFFENLRHFFCVPPKNPVSSRNIVDFGLLILEINALFFGTIAR